MRVKPGEQRGPCRAAASRVVELSESQAVSSKSVQHGSSNLTAVTADVRITHVIGQNDNDVWSGWLSHCYESKTEPRTAGKREFHADRQNKVQMRSAQRGNPVSENQGQRAILREASLVFRPTAIATHFDDLRIKPGDHLNQIALFRHDLLNVPIHARHFIGAS